MSETHKTRKPRKQVESAKGQDPTGPAGPTGRQEPSGSVSRSQIPFGKGFDVTVTKSATMTIEEIRAFYGEKFKISDADKQSLLSAREDDSNVEYTPILASEDVVKTRRKKQSSEKTMVTVTEEKVEPWPTRTDVHCWWCCNPFDTVPVPCPVKFDSTRNRYKTTGMFCSWSCAAAYSVENHMQNTLVYQMYLDLHGETSKFGVAPSRYLLKQFGGAMDIAEFRKGLNHQVERLDL